MDNIICASCGFTYISSNTASSKCPKCGLRVKSSFWGKLLGGGKKKREKIPKNNISEQTISNSSLDQADINGNPSAENNTRQDFEIATLSGFYRRLIARATGVNEKEVDQRRVAEMVSALDEKMKKEFLTTIAEYGEERFIEVYLESLKDDLK